MKRSAFGGGLGGLLSDLRHRRLFRGRESRRSGSGGSWGTRLGTWLVGRIVLDLRPLPAADHKPD
jgi:hypothetical protein